MPAKDSTKATNKATTAKGPDISWQAQKSAMTRDRILDAAIQCFISLGYTNVTTAKVASSAGVSRGAMLHHFPSKTELIQSAVEYLHGISVNHVMTDGMIIGGDDLRLVGKSHKQGAVSSL